MQFADAIPLRGVAAEVVLRRRGAGSAHGGQPLAIARNDGSFGIEARDQGSGNVGGAAALTQAKERP